MNDKEKNINTRISFVKLLKKLILINSIITWLFVALFFVTSIILFINVEIVLGLFLLGVIIAILFITYAINSFVNYWIQHINYKIEYLKVNWPKE